MEATQERVKDYQEQLKTWSTKKKEYEAGLWKRWKAILRESLNSNKNWSKTLQEDHYKYCLGNLNVFNAK